MTEQKINEQTPPLHKTSVSSSACNGKPIWLDYYLKNFKWYRKYRKLNWYKHEFTPDALELSITFVGTFWALYGEINRYSKVVDTELWLHYC